MSEWWNAMPVLQQFFYLLAIPGTVLLVIQTILLLIGLGNGDSDLDHGADSDDSVEMDYDADGDGSCDVDHDFEHDGDTDHDTPDAGLRLFTVRSIVAFFAVGGWTGVALMDLHVHAAIASILAIVAGFAAMLLVAAALLLLTKLQDDGNINMRNAIGVVGEVYVPIPENGKGKITLILQERFTEADAICPTGALKTGQAVAVVDVAENNILVVKPIVP